MAYIPPLAGAMAQSTQVQRIQSDDKDRQLRRAEALRRNSATPNDDNDHEVESPDEIVLQTQEDEHHNQQRRKRRQHKSLEGDPDDPPGESHLNVVA